MTLAFATKDGKFVSQHFGHSPSFSIVELNTGDYTWQYVGERDTAPPCELGNHDHDKLRARVASLDDVDVLFVSKVGGFAYNLLNNAGIQVLEQIGFIEQLVEGYIKYLKRPNFKAARSVKLRDVVDNHPCFSEQAHNKSGRLHLPVSPACNIQCRFCNRQQNGYEQRPGVASGLICPEEAVDTVRRALQLCPEITVVGIAGPGDTLATPHALEAFRLVHAEFPNLILCLSTNGLALRGKANALWDAGVRTITVTVNAVDRAILPRVVSWIKDDGDLIAAQLQGIRDCSAVGMIVKVNTVLIPGVNDAHIAEIA
ncbi:MAG: radical SAM protein, partial [Oscillospiraceae bacterium]|nr:radical SAM protein [Oscillospiraceae bacterium]